MPVDYCISHAFTRTGSGAVNSGPHTNMASVRPQNHLIWLPLGLIFRQQSLIALWFYLYDREAGRISVLDWPLGSTASHGVLSTLTYRELPCSLYSLEQLHLLQRRYIQGILNDSNLLLFQAMTSS